MKKIFRKNQLVITALALMIAVAGYFSYMNNNMEDDQVTAEASADAGTVQDTYDISEEDMLAEQEIFTDEGTGEELALVEGTETAAVDAAQSGDVAQMTDGAADVENPGEAVLTSTTIANLDYAAEMKLNREQIRSKNKESLLEIVNNTTIDESLKAGCRQQDDRHDGYCRAGGSCGNAAGGKGMFRCGGEHHGR